METLSPASEEALIIDSLRTEKDGNPQRSFLRIVAERLIGPYEDRLDVINQQLRARPPHPRAHELVMEANENYFYRMTLLMLVTTEEVIAEDQDHFEIFNAKIPQFGTSFDLPARINSFLQSQRLAGALRRDPSGFQWLREHIKTIENQIEYSDSREKRFLLEGALRIAQRAKSDYEGLYLLVARAGLGPMPPEELIPVPNTLKRDNNL